MLSGILSAIVAALGTAVKAVAKGGAKALGTAGKAAASGGGKTILQKIFGEGIKKAGSKIVGETGREMLSKTLGNVASMATTQARPLITESLKNTIGGVANEGLKRTAQAAAKQTLGETMKSAGSKLGQNLFAGGLGGDNMGTDFLINTLSNLSQKDLFSADLKSPSFGENLASSAIGAAGQTAQQARQRQYENKQMLNQMAMQYDPTEQIYQEFQSEIPNEINAFQQYIVDLGAGKQGLAKGTYNSQDMLDIQRRYGQLQKTINQFNASTELIRKDREKMLDPKNLGVYDPEDFEMGMEYYKKYKQYPPDGLLHPAPINPDEYFLTTNFTPAGSWYDVNEYTQRSRMTPEMKALRIQADVASNVGLQKGIIRGGYYDKWKQEYGSDPNVQAVYKLGTPEEDQQGFMEFAAIQEYQNQIERDKVDLNRKNIVQNRERSSSQEKELPYRVVSDYQGQQGKSIVFTSPKKVNISAENLIDPAGQIKLTAADGIANVTLEYMDANGNLIVVADYGGQTKRFRVPATKARGIIEAAYGNVDQILNQVRGGGQAVNLSRPQTFQAPTVDPREAKWKGSLTTGTNAR